MSTPEDEYFPIVGERVRKARGSKGQKEFALEVNLSVPGLSRLETNGKLPRLATLIRIAKVTGRSLDWLVGLSDEERASSCPPELVEAADDLMRAQVALAAAASRVRSALGFGDQQSALAGRLARLGIPRQSIRPQYLDETLAPLVELAEYGDQRALEQLRSMQIPDTYQPGRSRGRAARKGSQGGPVCE